MSEQSGIKIQGLREISRALNNIGVPKTAIKEAAKESAELVLNEAKSLVPVRSGKLRNSIRLGATAAGKVTIRAGGARVPYANPIHWGWFKRNIKPQPFFSNALGYTREEIYRNYLGKMSELISTESAKQRKSVKLPPGAGYSITMPGGQTSIFTPGGQRIS